MASKSLEDLKGKLYQAFDHAITLKDSSMESGNNHDKVAGRAAAIQAAAQASDAIVKLEREIMLRDIVKELRAQGADIEVDFEKGIVRSISPMNKIKLKQPEV